MVKGKILKTEKKFSIPWFEQIEKTVLLPYEKEKQIFYSIKPPDYVTALTHTTGNKYIIVKQYRPVIEDYTFELPSGHRKDGETPVQAIIRELKEETGCVARGATMLGEIIPDTGRMENRLWAFYVKDVEIKHLPDPSQNEGIEIFLVTRRELLNMAKEGKLSHALDLSVIALAIIRNFLKM